MLYQPSYPQPYLSDIDATIENNFTCYINAEGGTQVVAYNLSIYSTNSTSTTPVYTTNKTTLSTPIYGQNTLSIPIPATNNGMVNGLDYIWTITLYSDNYDLWITNGYVKGNTVNTVNNIYINVSSAITSGQYVYIDNQIVEISSYDSNSGLMITASDLTSVPSSGDAYTIYYSYLNGNLSSTNTSTTTSLYLQASSLINVGQFVQINGEMRYISAYNSTTGVATLSVALSSAPSLGASYVIYNILESGTVKSNITNTTTNVRLTKSYLIENNQYIKINGQTVQITNYDTNSGVATLGTALTSVPTSGDAYSIYSNNVASVDYYFRARTTPTLTLGTITSPITSKSYTFTATYTQAENVGWKYYQWYFYDSHGNLIQQSDEINTGEISYTFNGFSNDRTCGVSLFLENQDDVQINLPITYFTISYTQPTISNEVIVTNLCDSNALEVTWNQLSVNSGTAEGSGATPYYTLVANQPYSGGSSVQINNGADIFWYVGSKEQPNYVPFESTSYINWSTNLYNFVGKVFEQTADYVTLLTMSTSAPTSCLEGDKYYNTDDKLIYNAITTNTWSVIGNAPISTALYYNIANSSVYQYDGSTLVSSSLSLPTYVVSYDGMGNFTYTITNIDTNLSGSVNVFTISNLWLLQSSGASTYNVYSWIDSSTWDDTKYWIEQTTDYVNEYWFKIVLLPTGIQVTKLAKQ